MSDTSWSHEEPVMILFGQAPELPPAPAPPHYMLCHSCDIKTFIQIIVFFLSDEGDRTYKT